MLDTDRLPPIALVKMLVGVSAYANRAVLFRYVYHDNRVQGPGYQWDCRYQSACKRVYAY